MLSVIRTYLRYAGRIGWYDGRRDYPGEEHYQELALHVLGAASADAHAAAAAQPAADTPALPTPSTNRQPRS